MDPALRWLFLTLALLSALPAWLCGGILRRHAQADGESPSEWIPFSVLPYAFTRFRHANKLAILWAYLFSNLLFVGAVIGLALTLRK